MSFTDRTEAMFQGWGTTDAAFNSFGRPIVKAHSLKLTKLGKNYTKMCICNIQLTTITAWSHRWDLAEPKG